MKRQIRPRPRNHRFCLRCLAIVVVFVFCSLLASAQNPILEAQFNGVGMTSPTGKHLYLRIWSNRYFEYENEHFKENKRQITIVKKRLSKNEFSNLSKFLNSSDINKLPDSYPEKPEGLDHVIELKITIFGQAMKVITLTNFSPKTNDANSAIVKKIICCIEKLRKNASFAITANSDTWCDN